MTNKNTPHYLLRDAKFVPGHMTSHDPNTLKRPILEQDYSWPNLYRRDTRSSGRSHPTRSAYSRKDHGELLSSYLHLGPGAWSRRNGSSLSPACAFMWRKMRRMLREAFTSRFQSVCRC